MKLSLRVTIGGGTETVTTTDALSVLTSYHIGVVVDGRDVTFYIWNDDTQTLTTEVFTNGFSNATRDAGAATYILSSSSAVSMRAWFDEMKVWNVAHTYEQVKDHRLPIEDPTSDATLVHYVKADDGPGSTTVADSSSTGANGTFSGAGSNLWLWAMEGDASLAGQPKSDGWGEIFGGKPTLVDGNRAIYQIVGGGPIEEFTAIREGGLAVTQDTDSTTYRAFILQAMDTSGTATASGHAATYKARGLFKLGRAPEKNVSVDFKGYNNGPLGYVDTAADIFRTIVQTRGNAQDDSKLDLDSFTQVNTDAPYVLGVFIADPRQKQIDALLSEIMGSVGLGEWGYVRGSDKLGMSIYTGPGVTADFDFTQNHVVLGTLDELDVRKTVIYSVELFYRPNAVPMSETDVGAALVGTTVSDPTLGDINAATFKDAELRIEKIDKATRDAFPDDASFVLTRHSYLRYRTDADIVAQAILDVMKGPHEGWHATFTHPAKEMSAGDDATLAYTEVVSGLVAFSLDGTDIYSVLSLTDRKATGVVEVDLWR